MHSGAIRAESKPSPPWRNATAAFRRQWRLSTCRAEPGRILPSEMKIAAMAADAVTIIGEM
jgi:hypothetical protein